MNHYFMMTTYLTLKDVKHPLLPAIKNLTVMTLSSLMLFVEW